MDERQPRTSRWLESIARWTLVCMVAVAMLGWLQPGTPGWASLAAGLMCVFVVWLLSKMAAGDRTVGGHPIYLVLAGLAGVLLWHLATSGLRKSHPDLSGELTVSMLFHVSLAAIAVLMSRELLGGDARRAPAVCGGAMMAGGTVALVWTFPPGHVASTSLVALVMAGLCLWFSARPLVSTQSKAWRWAAIALWCLPIAVVCAVIAGRVDKRHLPLAVVLVTAAALGLMALHPKATRRMGGTVGVLGGGIVVTLLAGGAALVLQTGLIEQLAAGCLRWSLLGAGEQAAAQVYAGDDGLEILAAVGGWFAVVWGALGALGTLLYLLIRARHLLHGKRSDVGPVAVAAVLATAALLAPGGLALPGGTLAAAVCWGMLAARANPNGRRWPGWLLLPAGAVVLLAMGVAGKPGLAQWAAMSLQDNRNFLHGPAGLLVGLLLAWLLGARRWWLGLIGIAIAISLGALGEVVQGVISHATKPIAAKGRLPEMEDFWYHLVGCSVALIAYLLTRRASGRRARQTAGRNTMRIPVTQMGLLIGLTAMAAGCPVTQPKPPGQIKSLTEKTTGRTYHLYVPTNYTPEKKWPLVITLHGTHGWDGSKRQVKEWAYLAEEKSFIVVAPYLTSTQGILPKVKSRWLKELDKDDRTILAVMNDLQGRFTIDPDAVLLSGFSAGGYPMYYTGLKHPERFNMLVARACNSSVYLFEQIAFTDAARNMPIAIFFGGDDLKPIQDQSWAAYRYLRGNRKCFNTVLKETEGGHLRRPETAYKFWLPHMPQAYRKP